MTEETTTCVDCGTTTTPGPGSARCTDCWNDRLGIFSIALPIKTIVHITPFLNTPENN